MLKYPFLKSRWDWTFQLSDLNYLELMRLNEEKAELKRIACKVTKIKEIFKTASHKNLQSELFELIKF